MTENNDTIILEKNKNNNNTNLDRKNNVLFTTATLVDSRRRDPTSQASPSSESP